MRNTPYRSDETMREALDRVGAVLDRWHENFLRRRDELEDRRDRDPAPLGQPTFS
jgi:hypothetical protein